MRDEERRLAVVEDELQLGRGEAHVERRQHTARQDHAVVRLEQLVGVAAEPGDAVTGPASDRPHRVRQSVGAVGQLRIGQAHLAVDDRVQRAEQPTGALEEVEWCERHAHGR